MQKVADSKHSIKNPRIEEIRKKGRYRDKTGLVSLFYFYQRYGCVYFDPFTTFLKLLSPFKTWKKFSYSFSTSELPRFFHIMVHVANDVRVAHWCKQKRLPIAASDLSPKPQPVTLEVEEISVSAKLYLWPINVMMRTSWEVCPKLFPSFLFFTPFPPYSSRKLGDILRILYDLPSYSLPSIFKHN